jgi:hypothetical protein
VYTLRHIPFKPSRQMSWSVYVQWFKVSVFFIRFHIVDICRIVDHHCLNSFQHFGESKDFYRTSIGFYFLNIQVLHSLDILKTRRYLLYLILCKAKTELFKKTFTYSGPNLWNVLPFSIWQASSHNVFIATARVFFFF